MKTIHLTEEELQQYAMDRTNCALATMEHVLSCRDCRAKALTYELLFTGIKEQPVAAFDFDVSELVLSQLPSRATATSSDNYFFYWLIAIIVGLTGTAAYSFRRYFISLFANTSLISYLVVVTIGCIMIAVCIDSYSNYHKKMKSLDFY